MAMMVKSKFNVEKAALFYDWENLKMNKDRE